MEIGATKAVQDRLKTTKIEESKGASLVFCWDTVSYTHLDVYKRQAVSLRTFINLNSEHPPLEWVLSV